MVITNNYDLVGTDASVARPYVRLGIRDEPTEDITARLA